MTKIATKEIKQVATRKRIKQVHPKPIQDQAAELLRKSLSGIYTVLSWLEDMSNAEREDFKKKSEPTMARLFKKTCIEQPKSEPKTTRKQKVKQ